MVILTKESEDKIEKICFVNHYWNLSKIIYVVAMVCICSYASYSNSYGVLYHRMLSFILTANVIWVMFDIIDSPFRKIMKIMRNRN